MSLARINQSTWAGRLGKTGRCGNCRREITKGQRYVWFKVGFRSNYRHIRCMDCPPRMSELESSKMSGVYAARENAEESLDSMGWPTWPASEAVDAMESVLNDCAEEWEAVADEYEEAAEAMGGSYGAGEAMSERADAIRSAASTLQDWSPSSDEPDPCPEHDETDEDCEDCMALAQEWFEELINEAKEHANEAEMEAGF